MLILVVKIIQHLILKLYVRSGHGVYFLAYSRHLLNRILVKMLRDIQFLQSVCFSRALGMVYLPWLIREIRQKLFKSGYHTPVCVFSVNALLESGAESHPEGAPAGEYSEGLVAEVLEVVRMEDKRWADLQVGQLVKLSDVKTHDLCLIKSLC
jgi:hypothetical protein